MTPRADLREDIVDALREIVQPLISVRKSDGGYNCCGCGTYRTLFDDVLSVILTGELSDDTLEAIELASDDDDELDDERSDDFLFERRNLPA